MEKNPLHQLMNPQSIATVGAGNNPLKMGAIQALSIVKDGYRGRFYPIHPTEREVFGHKAYPSAYDLPEAPDLVMFILPAPLVIQIMEEFGKIGTRNAIVITAGFRETGPEGQILEEKLKDTARRYGIRFLGPNCIGIINSEILLNVTVMPLTGQPGSLGMASQSGTYITQTLPYLQNRGISFSKAISVGNEADIDIIDAFEYLGEDQQTRAIALYIEGIKDGRRFIDTARRITPHKPVVAQYVGGSTAGARAGKSHTGAVAGPDYIYDGMLKQAGIIRVDTIEDLYYQGWTLATQPPLKGSRIGVITNSGGPGTAISHTCNAGGLEVPLFSEKLRSKIEQYIPPHGSSANPVDLTFHMDAQVLSTKLPDLILESGEVDGLVIHGLMGSGFLKAIFPHVSALLGIDNEAEFVSRFSSELTEPQSVAAKYQRPMILSSFFGREDNYTKTYQDLGVPVFDGPEKAARCMLALHKYNLIINRRTGKPDQLPPISAEANRIIQQAVADRQEIIDEYLSKKVLSAYGIPAVKEDLAHCVDQAGLIAREIGYPVALKGCSSRHAHKTGLGLIHLNLQQEDELRNAYSAITEAAGEEIPILVSKMIRGNRELMAGMIRQPGIGPCILFGLGGIFAEAIHDSSLRVAPLALTDTREMIEEIRAAEIINHYRNLPPVNLDQLGKILQTIGNLALLHPEVAEIDLNPVMISESSPVVVDALIVLKNSEQC